MGLIGESVLLILSNLPFLLASWRAFQWGRFTRACIYLLETIFSSAYHTCDSYNMCMFDYQTLKSLDFVFASFAVPLAALYLPYWRTTGDPKAVGIGYAWLEKLFMIYFFVFTAIAVVLTEGGSFGQVLILGLSFFFAVSYLIAYGYKWKSLPRYEWKSLSIALNLSVFSIMLFIIQEHIPGLYRWIHSIWHILAGLGQAYLIQSKSPVQPYLNAEARISSKVVPSRNVYTVARQWFVD